MGIRERLMLRIHVILVPAIPLLILLSGQQLRSGLVLSALYSVAVIWLWRAFRRGRTVAQVGLPMLVMDALLITAGLCGRGLATDGYQLYVLVLTASACGAPPCSPLCAPGSIQASRCTRAACNGCRAC